MVVRGPHLSGAISGTDPLKDNRLLPECTALDGSLDAVHTAKVVNALSDRMREILRLHPLNAERVAEGKGPANAVLLRGCGMRIEVRRVFHSPPTLGSGVKVWCLRLGFRV